MSSVDALAAAVAVVRERLRIVESLLANARREGDNLVGGLEQVGAVDRASQTRAIIGEVESQQAMIAGLDATVEQIQAAVEALRSTGSRGGAATSAPSASSILAGSASSSNGGSRSGHADVTLPRLAPDATRRPGGRPAAIKGKDTKQRSLEKENESAEVLARAGFDIEQNPPPKPNGKEPDYRIQDEYWDCYAPTGNSPRTIYSQLHDKVREGQAERIILNLDLSGASRDDVRARLERYPIRGLREIKIIEQGEITQFYPWESEA
ncbi:hypothetical protein AB0K52_00165 [Glycomyces sp. NPDC049804]|uniref:CdiA C-terminal domain-containing protein n=1 Tax=Glycomyces sp. NPDC049804 TaxID=3154363 RepID=UPI0034228E28